MRDALACLRRHSPTARVHAALAEPIWAWAAPEPFGAEPSFHAAVLRRALLRVRLWAEQ